MSLDYTAIDFETANSFRGSPCSVGLVKVRDGRPVDRLHLLIRPPVGADHFDGFNVRIHGITAQMVADQPRWADRLPQILAFIGDDIVVAHNAGFDIGVIRYACAVDNIPWPELNFACTLVLARRHLSLPSYRLPFVLDAYGLSIEDHHNALADADAVVSVVARIAADLTATGIEDLTQRLHTSTGYMAAGVYHGAVSTMSSGQRLVAATENPDADPGGYLYGRVVVFTGALLTMRRQDAWDAVTQAGGRPEKSTTKNTNVLVLGDFNPANLRPGATYSDKARRAFALQDKGQDIELMTEADFLQVLDGHTLLTTDLAALVAGTPDPGASNVDPAGPTPGAATGAAAPARTPRPLLLPPSPTDQTCTAQGCTNRAAFKTRSRATWCETHLVGLLRDTKLEPLEPFTHPRSYWLTRCTVCGCEAHYRLEYVLGQLNVGIPTCRACHWLEWAHMARAVQEQACREGGVAPEDTGFFDQTGLPFGQPHGYDHAQLDDLASAHSWDYLGEAPGSIDGFTHRVRCTRCTKIEVYRTCDLAFSCSCTPEN